MPRSATPATSAVNPSPGVSSKAEDGDRTADASDRTDALRLRDTVSIRYPIARDRVELVGLRIASRAHLEPWEPKPVDGVSTWGDEWFDRYLAQCRQPVSQRFVVVRRDDGAIVGQVSLGQIYRGPFSNACMGYWIGVGHTRRGYASQAITQVLERAFTQLGLHRVEANIMPGNTASLAVARAVGFRLEGYSPKYLQINGEWADHTRWAMTRDDWDKRCGVLPDNAACVPTVPIAPEQSGYTPMTLPVTVASDSGVRADSLGSRLSST